MQFFGKLTFCAVDIYETFRLSQEKSIRADVFCRVLKRYPPHSVRRVLNMLVHRGLLVSNRGRPGGYELPPLKVTLFAVMEATQTAPVRRLVSDLRIVPGPIRRGTKSIERELKRVVLADPKER